MKDMERWLRWQWPFWVSGVFVGLAEVLHCIRHHTFITFTTSIGQMFAGAETLLFGTAFFQKAFQPDINWVLLGVIFGAFLVALAEKEFRSWVRYERRALFLSFLGAALFSFGTRLAGGCTTHHVLGGLAAMNIASLVVTGVMLASALVALAVYARLGLAYHFKPQESLWYARQARALGLDDDAIGFDENYRPERDTLRRVLLGLALLFFGITLVGGVGKTWPHSLFSLGPADFLLLLFIGLLAGIGVAKTGFGTGCGIMTPELSLMLQRREPAFLRLRVNYLTRNMFMGMFPFTAILVAIIMLNVAVLIGWLVYGIPLPASREPRDFLTVGHVLGAVLMAFGSVFMLGCEIRNYMRLGLGYTTALAALPGFALGYVPYLFFKAAIDRWAWGRPFLTITSLPQLAADPAGQKAIALLYLALLLAFLLASLALGIRGTGLPLREANSVALERVMLKKFLRGHLTFQPGNSLKG